MQILGGDSRLWQLINLQPADFTGNETAINARLAERLRVHAGDDVSLFIEIPSAIPRESLLGKREGDFREIPLKIKAVIPDDAGAVRLTLNPTQQLPLNAFVPLATLQQSVELARVERSRRNPEGSPAQINALFVSAKAPADQTGATAPDAARTLSDELARLLVPADLGLRLGARHGPRLRFGRIAAADSRHRRRHGRHGECEEAGSQHFARARLSGQRTDERQGSEKVLNVFGRRRPRPGGDDEPAVWPLRVVSPAPIHPLAADEIVLNDWIAQDLERQAERRSPPEIPPHRLARRTARSRKDLSRRRHLKAHRPCGRPWPGPGGEGHHGRQNHQRLEAALPNASRSRHHRDDEYWDEHRATPKSFVSLDTAQKLWGNRFGSLTSVRVAPKAGQSLEQTATDMRREMLATLKPEQTHLQFLPVKYTGVVAAAGSNDFSELFLGFSFFLILAATFLIGLIFRLGIERAARRSVCWPPSALRPAGCAGCSWKRGCSWWRSAGCWGRRLAVGFAELMVYGLTHWWNQAVGTQSLAVYIVPATLAMGFVASMIVTALAVLWGLRQLKALSPRELLAGATEPAVSAATQRRRSRRSLAIGTALLIVAGLLLIGVMTGRLQGEAFEGLSWGVVLFFLDGMIILVGGVMLIAGLLDGEHSAAGARPRDDRSGAARRAQHGPAAAAKHGLGRADRGRHVCDRRRRRGPPQSGRRTA